MPETKQTVFGFKKLANIEYKKCVTYHLPTQHLHLAICGEATHSVSVDIQP